MTRAADALAIVGLMVVLLAMALRLSGVNDPEVRVTVVPVSSTTAGPGAADGT